MAEARENPAKRISIMRITEKMIQDKDSEYTPEMRNDVEIWGDQMPAHVRLFDCRACPAGGGNRENMRAGQMADHVVVFHKGRGDVISRGTQRWAERQASLAKKMLAAVREARTNQEEVA